MIRDTKLQHEIDLIAVCFDDYREHEVNGTCPHCGFINVVRLSNGKDGYIYSKYFICAKCGQRCKIRCKHYFNG